LEDKRHEIKISISMEGEPQREENWGRAEQKGLFLFNPFRNGEEMLRGGILTLLLDENAFREEKREELCEEDHCGETPPIGVGRKAKHSRRWVYIILNLAPSLRFMEEEGMSPEQLGAGTAISERGGRDCVRGSEGGLGKNQVEQRLLWTRESGRGRIKGLTVTKKGSKKKGVKSVETPSALDHRWVN